MLEKNIVIKGRSYQVRLPNVGAFIDIRVLKNQLLKGTGSSLLMSGNGLDLDAYLYIEAYSHIKIMLPQLMNDLNVPDLLSLSPGDFEELVKVYSEDILPWIRDYMQELKKPENLSGDAESKS